MSNAPTKEMNKQQAIHHQKWGAHMYWEMFETDSPYSYEDCEAMAAKHYAAARTFMGIKDKDQYYA